MLNYRFYRNHFPLWALALAEKHGYGLGPSQPGAVNNQV
jgi:hypothetical protein